MSDFRDATRRKVIEDLFGEGWRPDKPWEIAGAIGHVINGTPSDFGMYRQKVGEIRGRIDMLVMLDEAEQEANAPPSQQKQG